MLYEERSEERVMLFLDLRNLTASVVALRRRHEGWDLDLEELARALVGRRTLRKAVVFDAAPRKGDDSFVGENLMRSLRHLGFDTLVIPYAAGDRETQKQVDVALAIQLVKLSDANAFDTAILVSGDRDFLPAIHYVRGQGRRVEAAAWEGSYSPHLVEAEDRFHRLDGFHFLRFRGASN